MLGFIICYAITAVIAIVLGFIIIYDIVDEAPMKNYKVLNSLFMTVGCVLYLYAAPLLLIAFACEKFGQYYAKKYHKSYM